MTETRNNLLSKIVCRIKQTRKKMERRKMHIKIYFITIEITTLIQSGI